tara:strand:- start:554 stop:853 length:300 start_codon:yes stop_codon:yes gene_type:complete
MNRYGREGKKLIDEIINNGRTNSSCKEFRKDFTRSNIYVPSSTNSYISRGMDIVEHGAQQRVIFNGANTHLQESRLLRQLLNGIPAIRENSILSVNMTD